MGYYDITDFDRAADEFGAKIRIIFGQRANGKTYQVLKKILDNSKNGECGLYVRRWSDDLKISNIANMFSKHDNTIKYFQHAFYRDKNVVCYTAALTQSEHFKGTTLPETLTTILLDEFLPEKRELPNEFAHWQSVISTAVRDRTNVNIYLCGNTVRRVSTYFTHYGIDISKLKKGAISLIKVKQKDGSIIKIAVEWCDKNCEVTRNKNLYFVDIAAQNMIIDGDFEANKHYTNMLDGVSIKNWDKARKLSLSLLYNKIDYEIRIYNGIFIVKKGRRGKYVFTNVFTDINDGRVYFNTFPFVAYNQNFTQMQNYFIQNIKQNHFLAESIEVGEMIQELLNVKGE